MNRTAFLMISVLVLYGCGGDAGDRPDDAMADSDDADWVDDMQDEDIDDVETGAFSVDLPGEAGPTDALCSLIITRFPENALASVMLTLDVIGEGCDVTSRCDDPNKQNGDINYSGGIDGENPFSTAVVGYEPPGDPEVQSMWMFNAVYKEQPFSRFDLRVDGEPFDIRESDVRGADDFAKGPHVWNTEIVIEADMLKSTADDGPNETPVQARGTFTYKGGCEVVAKSMSL